MLPVVLDLSRLKLILIGDGAAAERRLALLDAAGAVDLSVYAPAASPALALAAGSRLVPRLPTAREMAMARLIFISDRLAPWSHAFATLARALGALVHVEDEPSLSDVQMPAVLRRGDLAIAVSTGGKSPGLAAQLTRFLARLFGPQWQGRLETLAALRQRWHAGGADGETIARWSAGWVCEQGWLPPEDAPTAAAAPETVIAEQRLARH